MVAKIQKKTFRDFDWLIAVIAIGIVCFGEHIGFSAQSLQAVIPEAVTANGQGYLMVNNDPILWTMLNAIQEQQKEIAALKSEVRKLRATKHVRRR